MLCWNSFLSEGWIAEKSSVLGRGSVGGMSGSISVPLFAAGQAAIMSSSFFLSFLAIGDPGAKGWVGLVGERSSIVSALELVSTRDHSIVVQPAHKRRQRGNRQASRALLNGCTPGLLSAAPREYKKVKT